MNDISSSFNPLAPIISIDYYDYAPTGSSNQFRTGICFDEKARGREKRIVFRKRDI
jgi:hypothetical protein